jgi:hypothetical protein
MKYFALTGSLEIFLALASNALEVFTVPPPTKRKEELPDATRSFSLDLPGHRTDVRTLSLTSDDALLASASNGKNNSRSNRGKCSLGTGSLKIWNMKTTSCIRTLDCGYAICSTFLPGDRHVRTLCFELRMMTDLSQGCNRDQEWRGSNLRHCIITARGYHTSTHRDPMVNAC